MEPIKFHRRNERGILRLSGEDRETFLQGLISNDTTRISAESAIYAALLTAQGKFLFDLFLVALEDSYLIDCDAERRADLLKRLNMYRLRSKITLVDVTADWSVFVIHGPDVHAKMDLLAHLGFARGFAGGVAYTDPRLVALGARAIVPKAVAPAAFQALNLQEDASGASYDRLRTALGVPDPVRDLVPEKSILLECGFDELHAIDWQKGCYMGQELTARTKYRGLVRKRLMPVEITGPVPPAGAPLLVGDQEMGEMRSAISDGSLGLAMIRLEALGSEARVVLRHGDTQLSPVIPSWMNLPELSSPK